MECFHTEQWQPLDFGQLVRELVLNVNRLESVEQYLRMNSRLKMQFCHAQNAPQKSRKNPQNARKKAQTDANPEF